MLSDRKQNLPTPQSSRRSTSTCKNILKNMIGPLDRDVDISMSACKQNNRLIEKSQMKNTDRILKNEEIKCIKLEESIKFLNKKIERQDQDILKITDAFAEERRKNQYLNKLVLSEREKTKKIEQALSTANKSLAEVRKKNSSIEAVNKSLSNKNEEAQKKIFKYKELLRKKETSIEEMKEKISQKVQIQQIIDKLKEELNSLRENYIICKAKQSNTEKQMIQFTRIISQLQKQTHFYKTQLQLSKQRQKRLEKQCEQLDQMYDEQKKESESMEFQLKSMIEGQSLELMSLKQRAQQIKELQNTQAKSSSVYCEQISRILKKNIMDSNVRKKVEKSIIQTIEQLESGWNKVLMKTLTTDTYRY